MKSRSIAVRTARTHARNRGYDMATITHDLTIRLDESGGKLVFFTSRRDGARQVGGEDFSIEIDLKDLKNRGEVAAERLIGESVLGYFDHLTAGRLDLPRHYLDT